MTLAPASFLYDLAVGIADLLAPQGFGWQAKTATHPLYPMKLPNVTDGGVAHATALTVVPLTADPTLAQSEFRLSFLMRSTSDDVRDLWALESALSNGLLGQYPITLSTGVQLSTLTFRTSGAFMQDDGNRWLGTTDYVASVGRPTPHRH
jgi:hypothetical protein